MIKKIQRISAAFVLAGGMNVAKAEDAEAQQRCETGIASWYGPGFDGRQTANQEIFDQDDLTAASRTISNKENLSAEVTNLENGQTVVVRINDYGPHKKTGRVIDLSRGAAEEINMINAGTARVRVCVLS